MFPLVDFCVCVCILEVCGVCVVVSPSLSHFRIHSPMRPLISVLIGVLAVLIFTSSSHGSTEQANAPVSGGDIAAVHPDAHAIAKTSYAFASCSPHCSGHGDAIVIFKSKDSFDYRCLCYDDDERGHWSGAQCKKCAIGYSGSSCLEPALRYRLGSLEARLDEINQTIYEDLSATLERVSGHQEVIEKLKQNQAFLVARSLCSKFVNQGRVFPVYRKPENVSQDGVHLLARSSCTDVCKELSYAWRQPDGSAVDVTLSCAGSVNVAGQPDFPPPYKVNGNTFIYGWESGAGCDCCGSTDETRGRLFGPNWCCCAAEGGY